MATFSPGASGSGSEGGVAGSTSGESTSSKAALFGFLQNIGPERSSTRDGQAPKKRGPKPDSKPALTRRQELNRQAQRTHRERKEVYIKSLEEQVMQFKEVYTSEIQGKKAMVEEIRHLKSLLEMHGIPYSSMAPSRSRANSSAIGIGQLSSSIDTRAHQPSSPYGLMQTDPSVSTAYGSQLGSKGTMAGSLQSPFAGQESSSLGGASQFPSRVLPPQHQMQFQPPSASQPSPQYHLRQNAPLVQDQLGVDFALSSVSQSAYNPNVYPPRFPSQNRSGPGV